MEHLYSSEIRSVIHWQWYNILNQKNLCHRIAALYRYLHISTELTIACYHKHPATVWGLLSYATIIEHLSINVYLSAAQNLNVSSENHHRFKIYSLLPTVLSSVKRKQATNSD